MAAIVENTRVSESVEPIGSACDHGVFAGWRIDWSAVWVGALAAFCMLVLFGLVGGALGAHASATGSRLGDLKSMSIWGAVLAVCAGFFSSVVGGWIATKVSGIRHAEPGMLQGAITWLVLVPMLCLAAALGAGSLFGGWYGGLIGPPAAQSSGPAVIQPQAAAGQIIPPPATIANAAAREDSTEAARAARNSALGAITGLLLGLAGGVVGGWMGCGEPMNLSHYKTRRPVFRHSV